MKVCRLTEINKDFTGALLSQYKGGTIHLIILVGGKLEFCRDLCLNKFGKAITSKAEKILAKEQYADLVHVLYEDRDGIFSQIMENVLNEWSIGDAAYDDDFE